MITERDLQEAIAECQGERNPTANTCMKLAAFYTIYEHMYGKPKDGLSKSVQSDASYTAPPPPESGAISAKSESEFAGAIDGKAWNDVFPIFEELMATISVLNPRLYRAALRKFEDA